MKPRHIFLVGSHLVVLGLAYATARGRAENGTGKQGSQAPTKASDRGRPASAGDGQVLLEHFIEERKSATSPYEALKASLPVAEDPKAAVIAALEALRDTGLSVEEREQRLAELEVRVLHWMRHADDPGEVVDFLWQDEAARQMNVLDSLAHHAFRDMATEQGILKSWPWLWKNHHTHETFGRVTVAEMRSGGGFDLFARLYREMEHHPAFSSYRRFHVRESPEGKAEPFFQLVGGTTRFEEREALLNFATSHRHEEVRRDLLIGFARTSEEAARWLLEQESLDPVLADLIQLDRDLMASRDPSLDYDRRIEALQAMGDNGGKDRQSMMNELVFQDLNRVLKEGRDWRYEFRHGVSSLDDVVAAVRSAMPDVPPEGEEALVVSLYRQLVEEDSKKALPLLDALPEDRRREALFHSTWLSQVNIDPDDYLGFFSALPEPVTPEEKDLRTKGWNWKARGFLLRFGDDYVEWVKEMPEGIDKETAMNSLIWATREQNPAEARKLSEQLYPPKANEKE
jgi:hypothetical protein